MEICTVQFIQYNSFIGSDNLHGHAMFQEKSNRRTMYQVRCAPQRGKSKHKQTIIKWYELCGKYMMDIVYPKTSLKGPFNFLTNIGLATGIKTMSRNVFQSIDFTPQKNQWNWTSSHDTLPWPAIPKLSAKKSVTRWQGAKPSMPSPSDPSKAAMFARSRPTWIGMLPVFDQFDTSSVVGFENINLQKCIDTCPLNNRFQWFHINPTSGSVEVMRELWMLRFMIPTFIIEFLLHQVNLWNRPWHPIIPSWEDLPPVNLSLSRVSKSKFQELPRATGRCEKLCRGRRDRWFGSSYLLTFKDYIAISAISYCILYVV